MSLKLALLFLVGFIALAGAIPVENPEEESKASEPAADAEEEAKEDESAPEGEEDEKDSEDEKQESDENEDDKEENAVEEKEEEQAEDNDEVSKRRRVYRRCTYVIRRKPVGCRYGKLRCKGSIYHPRGRCCRRTRRCRYILSRVRICRICTGYRCRQRCHFSRPYRHCFPYVRCYGRGRSRRCRRLRRCVLRRRRYCVRYHCYYTGCYNVG